MTSFVLEIAFRLLPEWRSLSVFDILVSAQPFGFGYLSFPTLSDQ